MKILLISYYYPPMGGAGVQRALKFSKYLPKHGVIPVVLSASDPHYVQDESLAGEVPADLDIHRVEHTPLIARLAAKRRKVVATNPPERINTSRIRPVLRDAILRSWGALQYPDDKAGWAQRAIQRARNILRHEAQSGEPVELIFTSSPPASAHSIGRRLSHEFDLPWVADFRDLWTDNPAYDGVPWRRVLDRRLEQSWLDEATGVVTVTESWQRMLAARRSASAPLAFIPNGYDEDDFENAIAGPSSSAFTLVHTGTFYGPRDPSGLLEGVSRYLDGPRAGHRPLRLRLIGNMGARFQADVQMFCARYAGTIDCIDYVPHARAVGELMAADALLLVVGGGRGTAVQGWLPGKIFEYLRAGKPLLMLGSPEGDAAHLIRKYGRGWIVEEKDADGVASALRSMMSAPGNQAASPMPCAENRESVECFERRELTRQMAEFMRECAALHTKRRRSANV